MSVVIRLSGTGKTHAISYRIVAAEKWSKRDGRNIEILGFYNPWQRAGDRYRIDRSRYDYWLSVGAKPSPVVAELVETEGNPKPKPVKARPKKETAATPTQPDQSQNDTESKEVKESPAEAAPSQPSEPSTPPEPTVEEPK